ncbi:MAG: GNAT family N-acetyltransferase, partial [Enterococcus hulanensis]
SSDWVVSTTLLAIRKKDQKIIGTIDIRHELNEFLLEFGGHIGFGVRPSERGKGYASEMLRLGLDYCKILGLEKVMVACYKENIASARTIRKNGGVLEREFSHDDGKEVQVYWINLSDKR